MGKIGDGPVSGSLFADRRFHLRLVAKDLDALGQVYDLYAGMVYGVALKVTSDRSASEEVTQAVFLDLWRRPELFDPELDVLRPWLATLAHQGAAAEAQRWAASRQHEEVAVADIDQLIDIDEIIQSVLNTQATRDALAALPDVESVPIRMAYFGGKTYRQVATDLGRSEDTIKSLMYSGLRRMAGRLHTEVVGRDR